MVKSRSNGLAVPPGSATRDSKNARRSSTTGASTRNPAAQRSIDHAWPKRPTQPSRWLRGIFGTLAYYDVKENHVSRFPARFRQVLVDHYGKTDPHTSHMYAPASSSIADRFDILCSFDIQGQNAIDIKSNTQHAFDFIIDSKKYKADNVTNRPPPGQDWQPIGDFNVFKSPRAEPRGLAERAVAHLTEFATKSRIAETFLHTIQGQQLLVEACTSKSEDRPCMFSFGECWLEPLDYLRVLAAILQSTDRGVVYRTDDSHQRVQDNTGYSWALSLVQTVKGSEAVPQVPYLVENIPVEALAKKLQVPGMFKDGIHTVSQEGVGANFGPTGSSVDLHIDHGMHVLSTVFDDGIKLWALYPPTLTNLNLFYEVSKQEEKLKQLAGKLKGGMFALTTGGTTIHLPSGWLHATYNIEGGFLVGTVWEDYRDLDILLDLFLREAEAHPKDAEYGSLIRICEKALEQNEDRETLLTTICPIWTVIAKVDGEKENKRDRFSPTGWNKFVKRAGMQGDETNCPGCKRAFRVHNPKV